jgi:general nucleoside transport system permease protein
MGGLASALGIFADAAFWIMAIAIAAPLLFAAVGALVGGQSGMLSLNIEGVFTAGALVAWLTAYSGRGHWSALAVAALVGAAIGLIYGLLTSPLQLPQRATGLAVSLFMVALCQCVYASAFPLSADAAQIAPFVPIDFSWLARRLNVPANLPYVAGIARVLFHAAVPVYLSLALLPIASYLIYRTPVGMALRACGRNPDAIIAQGRSVDCLRVGASAVGAALMAVGGATLALTGSGAFAFEQLSGRGFAAFTLALIAGWRIGRCLFAVLAFAMVDAYQLHLQRSLGSPFALTLSPLLPFVVTLIVLIATSRSTMRRFPLPKD